MHSNHFTSHDLDLLESYVHDCIDQLPKLPAATDAAVTGARAQIPTRCSSYHTVCTNMLKEVISLLSLFSPRLCRLIGQVWDLASLNVFVLLQVATTALQEAQQLRDQLAFAERFHTEGLQRQSSIVQRYEDDLARQRVSEQGLRAELQKVRQRANRLAVENGQLHLVVNRVLNAHDTMEATRYDSSNSVEHVVAQESNFCEDIAAVGDVEERELYGVDEDSLTRIEIVHPIESYSTDFEQLFQALFEGEDRNTRVLNEMDRFINSTAVALLWRYGSTEEEHQLMHRMLSASTVGTQTEGVFRQKPSHWKSESEDYESDNEGIHSHAPIQTHSSIQEEYEDEDSQQLQQSVNLEVLAVTKHQVIPATLRAQLDSRPRVQRVLEKSQLNRILLRLYLEKLECDARTLRRRRVLSANIARSGADTPSSDDHTVSVAVVRTPLHRFMKEFFLVRYEVPALADFHMMEIVKSCFYYHEQLKIAHRRGAAVDGSTSLVHCLPAMPEKLIQRIQHSTHQRQHHDQTAMHDHLQDLQQQQQFDASDIRLALFSRLCELVPFDVGGSPVDSTPIGGNVSACLLNAVVDVLGDILELDPSVPSLAAVEEVPTEANWGLPRGLASELLAQHFPFIDQDILEDTNAWLTRLAPVQRLDSIEDTGSADCIAVDVFLALFATTWMKYDQRLESKLRESFRHQLLLSSPFARTQLADAQAALNTTRLEIREASEPDNEVIRERPVSRMSTRRCSTNLPTLALGATAITMHSSPLELLTQAWTTLVNETLSSLDMEELENTFRGLLEAKHLDSKHRHVKKEIPEPTGSLGGVTEKEFVFHTLQVLRRRRNSYGLRTNSRRPPRYAAYGSHLLAAIGSDEMPVLLSSLKPGLNSDSLAYVSK
ncbi:hypothetical protein GN958_ATG18814 [Phytophthora infestans]|uniref:Uncharacterized protein n=2 Tax=Phytophthora infestans TaxID=4787 RepID=A0A8S9TTI1_PHYIN|nr:hypothetical protein GN958_ATG18814 [Phytophthora infestans]